MNYRYFLINSFKLKELDDLFILKYYFLDILEINLNAIIPEVYYKHNSHNDYVFLLINRKYQQSYHILYIFIRNKYYY